MKTGSANISYYNAIANEYNDMLDKNSDKIVRETVAAKFCGLVNAAVVLDFGGGTGLDLEWLVAKNHAIFFCEPSQGMREKAIRDHTDSRYDKVTFLDDSACDFRQWHIQPPFPIKVDAILSNFAVLNCIPGIGLLFQNLATVVKPGGHFFALVLTKNRAISRENFRNIFKSFVGNKPATINIRYEEHEQTVYIYSIKEIVKASAPYFNFLTSELFPKSGFTLIDLQRK